jgi:predicted nucleotidyltransferase
MARDWNQWLRNSSGPASDDEEAKRDRTEKRIKDAIAGSDIASAVRIYAKGSYANRTNVRLDSDVDICVEWNDTFAVSRFGDTEDATAAQLGYVPATVSFDPAVFRERVRTLLVSAFGSSYVDDSGNKSIFVAASSNTLDADVVPCREMRRYDRIGASPYVGSRLHPKRGGVVDNWPQQQYDNGVAKNKRTSGRYKSIIRGLKRLENEMVEQKIIPAPIPGFLIECLVWQAPDSCFGHDRMLDDLRSVFRSIWTPLKTDAGCNEWGEVNELKYLFRPSQSWKRADAFNFIDKAWDTVGVE